MARSVEEIQTAIKVSIRTYSSLDDFLFPEDGGSQVSMFNVLIFVVSAAMFTFEVIVDNLKADIQLIADTAPSGNESWLRQQILNFQYTDTVTINTTDNTAADYFVPVYDPVTPANRIVTQSVVSDGTAGSVIIKVAKGTAGSLTPLTAPESTALSNYYYGTSSTEGIGFAGVRATFVSLDSDRLYVDGDIYFLGQYVEATVKTAVIAAIDAFLSSFADENFGGNVYMIRLVDAIQAVEGVSRVTLNEIKARPDATPFASASVIDIQGVYTTISGHIISEDETGETLDDKLTMIEETL